MVIDRLHLCKCKKLRYSLEKKRPLPFDRVHKDSKWQKLFSRGHYHDYWFIYLCGSFVETISLFTGRRKRGGWGEIYGSTCARDSSQILAFQLSGGGGAVETKVLNPWRNIEDVDEEGTEEDNENDEENDDNPEAEEEEAEEDVDMD